MDGIPGFLRFKPPNLEGKNPSSPKLCQSLILENCLRNCTQSTLQKWLEMPAQRCTEGGKRGAVCCAPGTDQRGPEKSVTEGTHEKPMIWRQRTSRLCPSSHVGPLPITIFSLSSSHRSNLLCPVGQCDAGARSTTVHQTHRLFQQHRARRTFDVPQSGHAASPCFSKAHPWLLCSHPELVCTLLGGPQLRSPPAAATAALAAR